MARFLRTLACVVFLLAGVQRATAFSLLGPYAVDAANAVWQVTKIGYNVPGDGGGPMNLGEEYRYDIPQLTYGFDESFLNYFGTKGVRAVTEAMTIMNALPAFSQMTSDLREFPLDSRRYNYQAEALGLLDMKSWTMSLLMENLGVAGPTRWTWCIRKFTTIPNTAEPIGIWTVIKRNFDPLTFEPSSYVNGVLNTYQIVVWDPQANNYDAAEYEVDPNLPSVTAVADLIDVPPLAAASGYQASLSPGMFFSGLTRDDVAALRYLYRQSNLNVETAPTNTSGARPGSSTGVVGSGGSSGGNPFGQPPGGTNATGTNVLGTNFVSVALRPGVEKITFVSLVPDSQVGTWRPITNVWTDYYITNSSQTSQTLQRVSALPDILFSAADLVIAPDSAAAPLVLRSTGAFQNNDTINGAVGGIALSGPGQVAIGHQITFNKLGPWFITGNVPGAGEANQRSGLLWGSFDGTTNTPTVYPNGVSVQLLEQIILSGAADNDLNPYLAPPGATPAGGTTTTGTGGGSSGGTTGGGGGMH